MAFIFKIRIRDSDAELRHQVRILNPLSCGDPEEEPLKANFQDVDSCIYEIFTITGAIARELLGSENFESGRQSRSGNVDRETEVYG